MDSLRECREIEVKYTRDNAGVIGALCMQPLEIASIECDDNASCAGCILEHFSVGPTDAAAPGLLNRLYVVS